MSIGRINLPVGDLPPFLEMTTIISMRARAQMLWQHTQTILLPLESMMRAGQLVNVCNERMTEFRKLYADSLHAEALMIRFRPVDPELMDPLIAYLDHACHTLTPPAIDAIEFHPELTIMHLRTREALASGLSNLYEYACLLRARLLEQRADFVAQQRQDLLNGAAAVARVAVELNEFGRRPFARRVVDGLPGDGKTAIACQPQIEWLRYTTAEAAAAAILAAERVRAEKASLALQDVLRVIAGPGLPLAPSLVAVVDAQGNLEVSSSAYFSPGIMYVLKYTKGTVLPLYIEAAINQDHFACHHPGRTVLKWLMRYCSPTDLEFRRHLARIDGEITIVVKASNKIYPSSFVSLENCEHQEALMRRGFETAVLRFLDGEPAPK